jgi:hypothetical protein
MVVGGRRLSNQNFFLNYPYNYIYFQRKKNIFMLKNIFKFYLLKKKLFSLQTESPTPPLGTTAANYFLGHSHLYIVSNFVTQL